MLTNSQANTLVKSDPKAQAAYQEWRAQNPNATGTDFTAWATQWMQTAGKPAPQNFDITQTPTIQPGMFGAPSPVEQAPYVDRRQQAQPIYSQGDSALENYLKQFEWYTDPNWDRVARSGATGPGTSLYGDWNAPRETWKDAYTELMNKYGTTDRQAYLKQLGLPLRNSSTYGLADPKAASQYYSDVQKFIQANPSLAAPSVGGMLTGGSGSPTSPPVTGGNTGVPVTPGGSTGVGSGGSTGSFSGASSGGGAGMLGNNATWTRPVTPTGMFPTVQDSSAWQAQYKPKGLFS